MKEVYETKTQIGKTSKGLSKFWVARVITDGSLYYTQTESWQSLKDGFESEHILSTPKEINGKNIGKTNETTPKEQAISEIDSLTLKQQDKGYRDEGSQPEEKLPLPMLAHSYEDRAHNLIFPAYIQCKLDGTRVIFDGQKGWSRKGKLLGDDIIKHLKFDTRGHILDGELILPQPFTFQETVSATKKFGPNTPKLEYNVYDIVNEKLPYTERLAIINKLAKHFPKAIKMVPTFDVINDSEIPERHNEFVAQGYEGAMLRNKHGKYKCGHRSADLLKFKVFQDAEYQIVDVLEGEGKDKGTAIFVCLSANSEFRARPTGEEEQRREYFENKHLYINKYVTVQYFGVTDDGLPRFPVAKAVRDD